MPTISVGIDISKSTFDGAILFENNKVKTKKFANKPSGFEVFMDWLKKHAVLESHCCLEATGIYGDALATALFKAGHKVSIVNPARIKGFAQSELTRMKTDKADSQLIARFCKAMSPAVWVPKAEHILKLGAWVRRLEALQDLHRQEACRLESAADCVKPSIEAIQKRLGEEIAAVKKAIREQIESNSDLKNKQRLLETIPGVGEGTIAQVLAFIGNIEDFKSAKQVAAFLGLNPKHRQSGTSIRGQSRISKTGDAHLRKSFYMPSMSARKHNPIIKSFCERLQLAGKPPMVIIIAAMRKLVHIIYGVLKSGKAFDAKWTH